MERYLQTRSIYSFLMMAAVKSEVVADPAYDVRAIPVRVGGINDLPPMSAVLTFFSLMTPNVALAMLLAMSSRLNMTSCEQSVRHMHQSKRFYPR